MLALFACVWYTADNEKKKEALNVEEQQEKKICVCGSPMNYQGRQLIYMREPGYLHLQSFADYEEVELYICPKCRRGDFFFPRDIYGPVEQKGSIDFDEEYYRNQYEDDSESELRKRLSDPYVPGQVKEVIREILAERGGERPDEPERAKPDPWKKQEKKGLFSSLFGEEEKKTKKNQPPEF